MLIQLSNDNLIKSICYFLWYYIFNIQYDKLNIIVYKYIMKVIYVSLFNKWKAGLVLSKYYIWV